VGCGGAAPPSALVRLSVGPSGALAVGKGPGRGAWLCRGGPGCLERSIRRGTLERALRVTLAPNALEMLRARLVRTDASGEAAAQLCEDDGSGRNTGPTTEEGP
jgi:predicted RNA-binding protein YlxR (DUF448 family)